MFAETEDTEAIIESPIIQGVGFTGSTFAGAKVAEIAGRHLKKSVLELGGADPFIVLHDADIELAVEKGVTSRLVNSGQACINAKRFIVDESVMDKFSECMVEKLKTIKTGDPLDVETNVGPLARYDLYEQLIDQATRVHQSGARILHGAIPKADPTKGNVFAPLVFDQIPAGSPAFTEEFFGPVFNLFSVKGTEEAIELANSTEYGLGAAVFGQEGVEEVASRIESGMVFVNEFTKSDSRLPYGGIKRSGFGRECGPEGIREFTNVKPIWIN